VVGEVFEVTDRKWRGIGTIPQSGYRRRAAFGKECTPQTPLGAPMVSSEGACAAYHAGRFRVL
jgi:hydrogenase expression/formation protein HypD